MQHGKYRRFRGDSEVLFVTIGSRSCREPVMEPKKPVLRAPPPYCPGPESEPVKAENDSRKIVVVTVECDQQRKVPMAVGRISCRAGK